MREFWFGRIVIGASVFLTGFFAVLFGVALHNGAAVTDPTGYELFVLFVAMIGAFLVALFCLMAWERDEHNRAAYRAAYRAAQARTAAKRAARFSTIGYAPCDLRGFSKSKR